MPNSHAIETAEHVKALFRKRGYGPNRRFSPDGIVLKKDTMLADPRDVLAALNEGREKKPKWTMMMDDFPVPTDARETIESQTDILLDVTFYRPERTRRRSFTQGHEKDGAHQ